MSPFQIIVVVLCACLCAGSLVAMSKRWIARRESLIWAAVWLVAGICVIWPELTTHAAGVLGIHRGADLVLYCAVMAMLMGFLLVYVRLRSLRRELTLLVRRLAIAEATGRAGVQDAEGSSDHRSTRETDSSRPAGD